MSDAPLRLELLDIVRMIVTGDPSEGAVVTARGFDGRAVDIHLTAEALVKLEAFLARANLEQAKRQPTH